MVGEGVVVLLKSVRPEDRAFWFEKARGSRGSHTGIGFGREEGEARQGLTGSQ